MAYGHVEGVDGRGPALKGSMFRRRALPDTSRVVVWVSRTPDSFLRSQLTASAGQPGQVPGCVIMFETVLADSCVAVIAAIAAVGVRCGTHADAR